MKKAVLYARVSSDAQQKEGTIESQVVELKRQIAAAGHVLVREYIDDGYGGTLLDRPALNQLRADLKSDAFDTVYFLAADRIARAAAHQTIIVDELLKHGKRITIAGKDYEENPENKFACNRICHIRTSNYLIHPLSPVTLIARLSLAGRILHFARAALSGAARRSQGRRAL